MKKIFKKKTIKIVSLAICAIFAASAVAGCGNICG